MPRQLLYPSHHFPKRRRLKSAKLSDFFRQLGPTGRRTGEPAEITRQLPRGLESWLLAVTQRSHSRRIGRGERWNGRRRLIHGRPGQWRSRLCLSARSAMATVFLL